MKINRDDFLMMPDEKLRDIYRARIKIRKWLSAPPIFISAVCAALYFCAGYFNLTIFNSRFSNPVLPVLMPIFFFVLSLVSGMLMFNDKEETHLWAAIIITSLQIVIYAYGMYKELFSDITHLYIIECLASCCIGHIIMIPLIRDLNALRACPSFPFDNHRRTETYISSISGERGLKYLENAYDTEIKSVDLDDIFSIAAKKAQTAEEKKPYEDDFFQQHDMSYGKDK